MTAQAQRTRIGLWRCHRPFVVVVSFYAVGLLLAEWVRPPLVLLFVASLLTLFLVLAIAKWRPFLLCALLVLIGWANLIVHTAIISPNDLRRLIGDQTEFATLRGILVRAPQIKISERRGAEIERSQAELHVSEIQLGDTWQPADGDIIVSTPLATAAQTTRPRTKAAAHSADRSQTARSKTTRARTRAPAHTTGRARTRVAAHAADPAQTDADGQTVETPAQTVATAQTMKDPAQAMVGAVQTAGTNLFGGQTVEISGTISRPPLASAEGLFDDRDYLQTRGIFYELRTRSQDDWHLRDPVLPRPPLTDRFLEWSRRVLALGLPEDQTLRLLWAMTLGWRTAFTGDVGDPILRAGTMHLFAIDGLRIGLISGMLVTLLRVLQVSRGWCGAIAIPAIWFYTAATGWESSAVRASIMMTLMLGGWAFKRPADLLNSLGGAAFLILLWDPRQLFEASFQLSFFVMLTIALLLPPLNDLSDGLLQHDPLLPAELVPKWRRTLTQSLGFQPVIFRFRWPRGLGPSL